MSKYWTYSSKLCFLKKLPQFFPWGNSVRTMGIQTTGPAVKNHISSEMAKELIAVYQTMCHSLSLVYKQVPLQRATPISSTSSSQDSVFDVCRYTENPATERSGSTSEELRGHAAFFNKTENTNKNEGHEEVQSNLLHDLPDWLQEFRENLVDESSPPEPERNPAPKDQDTSSSSHESPI